MTGDLRLIPQPGALCHLMQISPANEPWPDCMHEQAVQPHHPPVAGVGAPGGKAHRPFCVALGGEACDQRADMRAPADVSRPPSLQPRWKVRRGLLRWDSAGELKKGRCLQWAHTLPWGRVCRPSATEYKP